MHLKCQTRLYVMQNPKTTLDIEKFVIYKSCEYERPFYCGYGECDKNYSKKQHLVRHISVAHYKIPRSNKRFLCFFCSEHFASKQNVYKHIERKHKNFPFVCHICSKGFTKQTLLARHIYYHTGEKLLKCKYCERTFSNQPERSKHEANHKIYTCYCDKTFMRWADFVKHKKDHSLANQEEYHCDNCGKIFKSREYIVRHMKTHTFSDERSVFLCPLCPKYYLFKCNLTQHIRHVHENFTHDCIYPGCEAKLSTKSRLDYHYEKHFMSKLPKEKSLKKRLTRKDAGTMKRSTAVKLSGEIIPLKAEKELITIGSIKNEPEVLF